MNAIEYTDFIMHHGIKGQRWGIRRYQNEDGSLTPAGEKRYYKMQRKMTDDLYKSIQGTNKDIEYEQKRLERLDPNVPADSWERSLSKQVIRENKAYIAATKKRIDKYKSMSFSVLQNAVHEKNKEKAKEHVRTLAFFPTLTILDATLGAGANIANDIKYNRDFKKQKKKSD